MKNISVKTGCRFREKGKCCYLYALNLDKKNDMVLERTAGEVIIRLPGNINWEDLQLMIKFIQYRERVAKSKAKQEDIDRLASEVNKQWWAENKHR